MPALPTAAGGAGSDEVPRYDCAPDSALPVRYHTMEISNDRLVRNIEKLLYQPRSFGPGTDVDADQFGSTMVDNAGRYLGWDVLPARPSWRPSIQRSSQRPAGSLL